MNKDSVKDASGDLGPGLDVADISSASIAVVRLATCPIPSRCSGLGKVVYLDIGEQLARLSTYCNHFVFPTILQTRQEQRVGLFYFVSCFQHST